MPVLTAERNVELPLLLTPLVEEPSAGSTSSTALKVVGLADRAKHYPRQLSGGQEQRVGIARAIVTDPTLLLCDEPTGDLDRKAGDEILDLLQALNREHGKTIVMVTHDPHAAERAARTLHLEKGTLIEQAVAHEISAARLAKSAAGARSGRSFTLLSIFVAFVLFAFLMTIRTAFSMGVEVAGADRLMMMHKVSLMQLLPIAYLAGHPVDAGRQLASHPRGLAAPTRTTRTSLPSWPSNPSRTCELYPEFSLAAGAAEGVARRSRGRSSAATSRTDSDGRSATGCRSRRTIWQPKEGCDVVVQYRRHLRRRPTRSTRPTSCSATTTWTRTAAALTGWWAGTSSRSTIRRAPRRSAKEPRRAVRELVGRNEDVHRKGVPRRAS